MSMLRHRCRIANMTGLQNIDAMLNIILGIIEADALGYGVNLVIASALISSLHEGKVASKYFIFGLGLFVLGITAPGFITWLLSLVPIDVQQADRLLIAVVSLIAIPSGLGLLYLPVHIAKKRSKKQLKWIYGLTILGIW